MPRPKIGILDYGMGNLFSLTNALNYVTDLEIKLCSNFRQLNKVEIIIIPGVGAFREAMENIRINNLLNSLNKNALIKKIPTLGICLGMQMLFDYSLEGGKTSGLGWIPGKVELIETQENLTVPHVGWNELKLLKKSTLFNYDFVDQSYYFVHSFYAKCPKKYQIASVNYGIDLTAVVQKENIIGIQCHPEKSQKNGLNFLKNFLNWAENKC